MRWGRNRDSRPSQAALRVKEGMKDVKESLKDARNRGLIVGERLRAMLRVMRSHPAFLPFVGIGFWVGKKVRSLSSGLNSRSARSPRGSIMLLAPMEAPSRSPPTHSWHCIGW